MEGILLLAIGFVCIVFPCLSLLFAIRNWLTSPPSLHGMIRHISREEQKDLEALDASRLDHDEKQFARRAIKAKYMRILHQLYFSDGDSKGY